MKATVSIFDLSRMCFFAASPIGDAQKAKTSSGPGKTNGTTVAAYSGAMTLGSVSPNRVICTWFTVSCSMLSRSPPRTADGYTFTLISPLLRFLTSSMNLSTAWNSGPGGEV